MENSQVVQLLHLQQEIGEEFSKENSRGLAGSQELSLMRLDIIRAATGNFSDECKLGEGGFGSVYRVSISVTQHVSVGKLGKSSNGSKLAESLSMA